MARETTTVIVSDVSGKKVPEKDAVTIRVTTHDALYTADASLKEVEDILKVARKSGKPGRKSGNGAENGSPENAENAENAEPTSESSD